MKRKSQKICYACKLNPFPVHRKLLIECLKILAKYKLLENANRLHNACISRARIDWAANKNIALNLIFPGLPPNSALAVIQAIWIYIMVLRYCRLSVWINFTSFLFVCASKNQSKYQRHVLYANCVNCIKSVVASEQVCT